MSDLQRYSGRHVLVTGGGSGIGQAATLRILREGGRVVAADISAAGPEDTLDKAGADRAAVGPDAVAAVVAMPGSPDAYFVTGTQARVDGKSHM